VRASFSLVCDIRRQYSLDAHPFGFTNAADRSCLASLRSPNMTAAQEEELIDTCFHCNSVDRKVSDIAEVFGLLTDVGAPLRSEARQ
jgi:hypothetical protein